LCYQYGDGIEKDQAKAIEWLTKAAQQEEPNALFSLGTNYEYGSGVKKNLAKALECFQKSADLGNEDGKSALYDLKIKMDVRQ